MSKKKMHKNVRREGEGQKLAKIYLKCINFGSDFSRFLRVLVLTWDYLRGSLSGKFYGIHTNSTVSKQSRMLTCGCIN